MGEAAVKLAEVVNDDSARTTRTRFRTAKPADALLYVCSYAVVSQKS